MRFSSTLICVKSRRPSGTWTIPCSITRYAGIWSMRTPSNSTLPLRGLISAETVLMIVDLPAPFAPTSTTISPGRTSKETSQSTCRSP